MPATEPARPRAPEPGPIERAILGDAPTLTGEQVASAAGLTVEDARRMWRALGFADPGDQVAFAQKDADTLAAVARTASEAGVGFETLLKLTRAVGQTTARLADWQVATLATVLEEHQRPDPLALVESMGPLFDDMLRYAWRRHLAVAVGRIETMGSDDEEDFQVPQATVGFADLVGFTALSNELGEDELGDLVEVFESRCYDVVTSHHGRVVKTLGDSVLFLCEAPEQGIDTALDIIAVIGRDERLPDVHLGMATGPVVLRMGDVYGPVVNLASRLTNVARRNRLIIDQATADLLPEEQFETRPLPARPVRGFGDVEPVTVRRTRPRH